MRGMGNMQGMMKKMQKMQKEMMEAQEALNASCSICRRQGNEKVVSSEQFANASTPIEVTLGIMMDSNCLHP